VRKIISLIHLSLDGLSAGPNNELDWISYDAELEAEAHSLHDTTDAVIWGRQTYDMMASYWLTVPGDPESDPEALKHAHYLEGATKIVVSTTLDRVDWGDTTNTVLIKDNIAEQINQIKQQPGKDIWFLGSPNLAQTFMELDLIDEYRFNINPVILSQGKHFFTDVTRKIPLKLLQTKTLQSGVITLRYEPDRK
jgi:dihydrofolate reductase